MNLTKKGRMYSYSSGLNYLLIRETTEGLWIADDEEHNYSNACKTPKGAVLSWIRKFGDDF